MSPAIRMFVIPFPRSGSQLTNVFTIYFPKELLRHRVWDKNNRQMKVNWIVRHILSPTLRSDIHYEFTTKHKNFKNFRILSFNSVRHQFLGRVWKGISLCVYIEFKVYFSFTYFSSILCVIQLSQTNTSLMFP